MEIDYKDIGVRIKELRLKQNIPQEKLAELADLSIPHMSHIETGNTKLSLPALFSIANALGVLMDDIAPASLEASKPVYDKEMQELLADCDEKTTRYLVGLVKAAKSLLKERDQ